MSLDTPTPTVYLWKVGRGQNGIPMPVDIEVKQPEERPHIIRPERFYHQAKIDKTERWRSAHRFGDMSPATLTSILQEAGEKGQLSRWADMCEYMLETDAHLASLIDTRIQRVVQAPRAIRPGKCADTGKQRWAEPAANFCRDVIDAIERWDEYLGWFVSAIGPGYSASEMIWERAVHLNAMVISGFRFAHPHRFHWGEDWDLRLYEDGRKEAETYGQMLVEDNWMVHVAANRGTYPGKAGVLRGCAWPWLFKQWFKKFHAHGVEVHASPFVTAKVSNEAQGDTMDEVVSKLENLSYDTVAAFREGTEVVFHNTGGIGTGEVYVRAIEAADAAQTKLVLGAEDIVTPGTHGSQSAVESRVEATLDPRTVADAKRLAADIRDRIFEPLCRINNHLFGYTDPPIPEYVFGGDAEEEEKPYEVRGEAAEPEPAETDDLGHLSPEEMAAVREMRRQAAAPKATAAPAAASGQVQASATGQTYRRYQNPIAKALSGE